MNEFAKKVSEYYDNLAFSMLGQFGINKDNWRENVGRIEIWAVSQRPEDGKHFFVDGEYKFSILSHLDELIFDEQAYKYKATFKYKVEIIESMKGKKL